MKRRMAVVFSTLALVIGYKCGLSQQGTSASTSVGQKAVSVILKHYSLNPAALEPTTGKALPIDGAWSISKAIPASCPQNTGSCVEVSYNLPALAVHFSWVVALNAEGTDGTFLDENDNTEHYLLRKLSPDEVMPLVQNRSKPIYPPIAIAAHVSGTVVLDALVDKTGLVEKVAVVSGPAMLQSTSIDAAKKWTFTPTVVGSRPVPYEVHLVFSFKTSGPPFGSVALTP